jgi:hypothetical protein
MRLAVGAATALALTLLNAPLGAVHRSVAATDGEQQVHAAVTCSM